MRGAYSEYQREVACGLLPDRPTECFLVTRTRFAAPLTQWVIVMVTFHEGLDLIDRFGLERGISLIQAAPDGRECRREFDAPTNVNVDWTVNSDGSLQLHATSGPFQPHGDDRTPPRGAQALGAFCN